MVGSHKILTVSYGTFSCTLEGFEDPFAAMKGIAEYFRDLAADDRYFGAEPPTPDAEHLARIAEREVSRRVEARMEPAGVVLRMEGPSGRSPGARAEAPPEPSFEPLSQAPASPDPPEPEAGPTADPVHVAAADASAPPSGDSPSESPVDRSVDEPVDTSGDNPADGSLEVERDRAWEDATGRAAPALMPPPPAPPGDLADPDDMAAKLRRIRAAVDAAAPSMEGETGPDGLVAAPAPEADAEQAPVPAPEPAPEPAHESTAEAEPAPPLPPGPDLDPPCVVLMHRPRIDPPEDLGPGAAATTPPTAPEGAPPEVAPSDPPRSEGAPPVDDAAPGSPRSDAPDPGAPTRSGAPVEEPEADLAGGPRHPVLADDPDGDEAAMSRILSRTEAQLSGPDARRRREAMAALRAAVAATEAARRLGELPAAPAPSAEGFRDDLRRAVRPRRPATAPDQAERPTRPAPLKLVASQRVDLDPPTALAVPHGAGRPSPIRPRRVRLDDGVAAPWDVGPGPARLDAGSEDFAAFAAEVGATSLVDLVEAAAAHATALAGADDFSRGEVIDQARRVLGQEVRREDGLRAFGTLLRQGRIARAQGGRFRLGGESRFVAARRGA